MPRFQSHHEPPLQAVLGVPLNFPVLSASLLLLPLPVLLLVVVAVAVVLHSRYLSLPEELD